MKRVFACSLLVAVFAAPVFGQVTDSRDNNTRVPTPPRKLEGWEPQAQATCEEQKRRYAESQACFAPYRLANGGIRPEAYEKCKEAPQPQC